MQRGMYWDISIIIRHRAAVAKRVSIARHSPRSIDCNHQGAFSLV